MHINPKVTNRIPIDIIIVSSNNRDILKECIDSIEQQTYKDHTVYLLDNDSTDGTKEFIVKNYPAVRFIDIPKEGPSKKRNIGIQQSTSKYIVLMDSDARLTKYWLDYAVNYMEKHEDVGICGGKILKANNLIDSAGGIVSRKGGANVIGNNEIDSKQYESFKRVSFIPSASLIMRRKMISEIGGFDPVYFYGYEDTDLGLRANISGWKVVYNPDLISYHLGFSTMKKKPKKENTFRGERNKVYTFLKDFQLKTILTYSPLLFLDFLNAISFKQNKNEIFKAYLWNISNLGYIMKRRHEIHKARKIDDSQLFSEIYFPILGRFANVKSNRYLKFFKNIKRKDLKHITFFVTTQCNSKCKHCFYWKELNKEDLSLEGIDKILSKFPNVENILLSGGEPFVRKDFVEVIGLIVKYLNPKSIGIPTNCLLDKKILSDMKQVLTNHHQVVFGMGCSLDGTEKVHDTIRGVEGSFKKTIALINELNSLKCKYPNLKHISVNTVITQENERDLPKLVELVKSLDVSNHFFDLIRGDHQGILNLPKKQSFKSINRLRYDTRKYYIAKSHSNPLKRLFANLAERHIIIIQNELLIKNKKWPFKCTAGRDNLVLESDGTIRICELTEKLGSLYDHNIKDLLMTKKAREIFNQILDHKCDCSHICNLSLSINTSYKDIFLNRLLLDSLKSVKYFGI